MQSSKQTSSSSARTIAAVVARCRSTYAAEAMLPVAKRKAVVRRIATLVKECEPQLLAAVKQDLGKSAFETRITEISMILHEAHTIEDRLDDWVRPQPALREGVQKMMDTAYVKRDPLGVVLVIGAWNYPLQLTLMPLLGALAGGNTVVLKPSEVAPATSKLLAELLGAVVDPGVVAVVEGGVEETTALLTHRFDHILYTGSSPVGRIVAAAAAKHLTPVTLELGGKSPVIVDRSADLRTVARRVLWGRMVNAGQTCIAPDYILVQRDVAQRLVGELRAARTAFLGKDPRASKGYGRIVNDAHYRRVVRLMEHGKVVVGGERDAASRYIAPTVLDGVDTESPLMTEEVFGPLLPLVYYETTADACAFIRERPKPLALYIFSGKDSVVDYVLQHTSSGGVTVNDTLMHASVSGLPFGGVGDSGSGGYHGKHTFDTFTHRKSVLVRSQGLEGVNSLRYPPYTEHKSQILMANAIGRRAGYVLRSRL